jgi:hypothetical protein
MRILKPIANNRHHVAIVDDIGLVCQTPMARNDVGAAFLLVTSNLDVDDAVETADDAH